MHCRLNRRFLAHQLPLGFCLLVSILVGRGNAALLGYDPFRAGGTDPIAANGQYETGTGFSDDSLIGQAPTTLGFGAGAWASSSSFANFVYYRTESGQLNYIDASGQHLRTANGQLNLFRSSGTSAAPKEAVRDISIGMSLPSELYYSMLVQFSPGQSFEFQSSSTDGGSVRPYGFGIDASGNPYVFGNGGGTVTNPGVTVTSDTPHLLVAKLTNDGFASDQIDLYLDPILGSEAANTPIATLDAGDFYVAGNGSWGVGDLLFNNIIDTPASSIIMDEVRIGTTFADVTPAIPEPATLTLALVGLFTALGLERRSRARA